MQTDPLSVLDTEIGSNWLSDGDGTPGAVEPNAAAGQGCEPNGGGGGYHVG